MFETFDSVERAQSLRCDLVRRGWKIRVAWWPRIFGRWHVYCWGKAGPFRCEFDYVGSSYDEAIDMADMIARRLEEIYANPVSPE